MRKTFIASSTLLFTTLLSSCGTTKLQQSGDVLTTKTWQLSTLNGNDVSTAGFSKSLPYINFSTDNKITGNGGCNGFSGSYNISEEGDINVSQVIATKMYCEGVNETEFMQALNKVSTTKVEADRLTLMEGVDVIMTLTPKSTTSKKQ